jgi:hypothetical protein
MSYAEKYLKIIIGLGTGQMGNGAPAEYYTLTDFRASAEITAYGGETMGQAIVKIYGLSLELMNKLTTIGPIMTQVRGQNSIVILAGENPQALTKIYSGTIMTGIADFNNAPDVSFEVTALSASLAAMTPVQATAIAGPVSETQLFGGFAASLGLQLNNVDVVHQFNNPTFNGSMRNQILAAAHEADCDVTFDDSFLNIKGRFSFFGQNPVIISPSTGMVGYPLLSSDYMYVKSIFQSTLIQGGRIQVQDSQLKAANGLWTVVSVKHELESMMPNGKWFTTCGVFAHGLS